MSTQSCAMLQPGIALVPCNVGHERKASFDDIKRDATYSKYSEDEMDKSME